MFRIKHGTLYTSTQLLAAEDRLLRLAHSSTAPIVPHDMVGRVTRRTDRKAGDFLPIKPERSP